MRFQSIAIVLAGVLCFCAEARASAVRELHVMSYNILNADWWEDGTQGLWGDRKPAVFKAISDASPDIIGLQEVNYAQYEQLREFFGGTYTVCWAQALKNSETTYGNAIMFKSSAYRFATEHGCGHQPLENPLKLAHTRNFVFAELEENTVLPGPPFLFISTHFAANGADAQGNRLDRTCNRAASAQQIMKFIASRGREAVVVGDLNAFHDPDAPEAWWWEAHRQAPVQSPELKLLTTPGHQVPCGGETYKNSTGRTLVGAFWPKLRSQDVSSRGLVSTAEHNFRIDHIFVTSGFMSYSAFFAGDDTFTYEDTIPLELNDVRINVAETRKSYPSDHFAIGARLWR
jgi:endonuclease/exonuclease/phosphatase family metal-dependent hydrolase